MITTISSFFMFGNVEQGTFEAISSVLGLTNLTINSVSVSGNEIDIDANRSLTSAEAQQIVAYVAANPISISFEKSAEQ